MDGRFQLGQDVSDVTLAAEFGVSRGPIREALLALVAEGLLDHHHNRGFRVPCLSSDDLQQISVVRLPLEAMALDLARQTVTPANLEKLQQLKADMLGVFETSYPLGPRRQDLAFHAEIWKLAKNPWLETTLTRLCLSYLIYSPATGLVEKLLATRVLDEIHTVYIDYLAGNSTLTALECVKIHLDLGSSTSIR
ncbi:MAG: GntR family transcriptional regulator, partial [Verrucomicrobia bacterium]|nr:GntR family transcriptional regulator [Verrucomicrobiota bacterium]